MKKLFSLLGIVVPSIFGLLSVFLVVSSRPAHAQHTDMQAMADLGGPKEFERRRHAVAESMKDGFLVMFARQVEPEADHYREDNDFYYLTGLADPGAVLLIDGKNARSMLLEPMQSARK